MKTVMQELIDEIKESYLNELEVLENADKYHEGDVRQARLLAHYGANIVSMAESKLEKEKEQMIEAVSFGNRQDCYDATETLGEQYYNETYGKQEIEKL